MRKAENQSIEWLRGLLAHAVFLGHLRSFLFVDHKSLQSPSWLTSLFYWLTSLGNEAVTVFFVVSGYLVGKTIINKMFRLNRWSWKEYLVRRLTRLWLVLIPVLVLGFCIERMGTSLFPNHPRYRQTPATFSPSEAQRLGMVHGYSVRDASDISTYIGNLFFFQNILVKTAGGNGPLWSLANEFWYYLLFPLIAAVFMPSSTWIRRLGSLSAGAFLLWWLPGTILGGFSAWLSGAALGAIEIKFGNVLSRRVPGLFPVAGGLGFALVTLSPRLGVNANFVTLGAILLCYASLIPQSPRRSIPFRFLHLSGRISYSLYLCHMSVMCFFVTLLLPERLTPSIGAFTVYVAFASGIFGYACLFYFLTERQTETVSVAMAKTFSLPPRTLGTSFPGRKRAA